jgi:hypothetical protein
MRNAGIAALFTVFVLSACGSDSSYEDTSPDDIARDVADAMGEVSSLRMAGTLTQEGQSIDVDLAMAESGNCEGTMSVEDQGSFELIVTDGNGFIKPDEQFWQSQGGPQADALIETVGDKWVAVTGDMAQAAAACDWDQFTSDLDDEENNDITEVTGSDEVDGEETVTVSFESDDGKPGVAHVLADDPHYVVRIEVDEQADLTFSDFDEPVEPEAPTETIDLADLQ